MYVLVIWENASSNALKTSCDLIIFSSGHYSKVNPLILSSRVAPCSSWVLNLMMSKPLVTDNISSIAGGHRKLKS